MSNRPLRIRLFHKQNGKCFYCPTVMNLKRPGKTNPACCTIDHKLPKAHGHGYEGNSVAACERCNNLKGDMTADEFVRTRSPQDFAPVVRHGPTEHHVRKVTHTAAIAAIMATKDRLRAPAPPPATIATSPLADLFPPDIVAKAVAHFRAKQSA